jgi:cysteine synthase A
MIVPVGESMLDMVGHTPVVRLSKVVPQGAADVFVKLEWFNPTGSYKDRMALAMVTEAERRGDLTPGMTVVEYSGGSTGSSLAYVCAAKGYRFRVVSSDAFAAEKLKTMRAFGADLTIIESDGGKVTPKLTPRMIGTAGLAMGVSGAFADAGADTRIVIIEPASTAVISGGEPGTHGVEGTGIGFIPPHLDADRYDEVRGIEEADGRAMARRLAAEQGLLAGTSTGLNITAAIDLAVELGAGKTVVTVACDTGLKYLAGDLYAT